MRPWPRDEISFRMTFRMGLARPRARPALFRNAVAKRSQPNLLAAHGLASRAVATQAGREPL
jgi:hypothetical protein